MFHLANSKGLPLKAKSSARTAVNVQSASGLDLEHLLRASESYRNYMR